MSIYGAEGVFEVMTGVMKCRQGDIHFEKPIKVELLPHQIDRGLVLRATFQAVAPFTGSSEEFLYEWGDQGWVHDAAYAFADGDIITVHQDIEIAQRELIR